MSKNTVYSIPFETESRPGDSAFVIVYADNSRPWENYNDASPELRQLNVPRCLLLTRSDGDFGFVGGTIEPGDSVHKTVVKEAKEEIGLVLERGMLQPLVAHQNGDRRTYAFTQKVDSTSLTNIAARAHGSDHFGSEVTGISMPHLVDYQALFGKWGGVGELFGNNFAATARQELAHFLVKRSIFNPTQLGEIVSRRGFNIDTLLA